MPDIIFRPHRCFPQTKAPVAFDGLLLKPGTNLGISDAGAQKLIAHPDYPRYRNWGAIEIVETKSEVAIAPDSEKPANLSVYNVEEADTLIENCHEIPTLEQWLSTESRVTVRRAINKRITAIKEGQE